MSLGGSTFHPKYKRINSYYQWILRSSLIDYLDSKIFDLNKLSMHLHHKDTLLNFYFYWKGILYPTFWYLYEIFLFFGLWYQLFQHNYPGNIIFIKVFYSFGRVFNILKYLRQCAHWISKYNCWWKYLN